MCSPTILQRQLQHNDFLICKSFRKNKMKKRETEWYKINNKANRNIIFTLILFLYFNLLYYLKFKYQLIHNASVR